MSEHTLYFYFFFQAEDGIRDKLVTGVQTCAIPIWVAGTIKKTSSVRRRPTRRSSDSTPSPGRTGIASSWVRGITVGGTVRARSEERRVGKECRSRWSPYH